VFGAAQYNGRPSAVLRARLDHTADLFERELAPNIVVTGGSQPGDEFTEARASADYLAKQHSIPQSSIIRENDGTNSWQSMASAANELKKAGKVEVILVTDPFHAARVDAMAEELGLRSRISPTRNSPISGTPLVRHFGRETVAVAAGRVVGFRRLMGIDRVADKVRDGVESR
jgi:uncharacterized SAM-binding protein YcdF (DUF218 family)